MSAIPERNRRLARDRFRGQCARCGLPGTDVHHRQRRREAGHAVCILVWLCRACHGWAHGHPADAKVAGFIIPPWEKEPASVPLHSYAGWVLFDDEGSYQHV